jgi:hypothetical protein
MNKAWKDIEKEVESEALLKFSQVPLEQRRELGLEPDTPRSYEKRQWAQVFVQMLSWREKCMQLHKQLGGSDV